MSVGSGYCLTTSEEAFSEKEATANQGHPSASPLDCHGDSVRYDIRSDENHTARSDVCNRLFSMLSQKLVPALNGALPCGIAQLKTRVFISLGIWAAL